MQTRRGGKRGTHRRLRQLYTAGALPRSVRSNGQALAALGATRIENGAAAARFHAHAKAVGALATGNGRLVSTFHGMIQRSEEHTSELQSLMRISYAVFCLKKKT